MVQPTVLVYDPDTGEWVTPEEYQKRLERRRQTQDIASLLQGAVISFTLTGTVCGTTVTLSGTGVIAAVGTGRPGPGPSAPGPGGGGPGGRGP
jgi:hypothetical protein